MASQQYPQLDRSLYPGLYSGPILQGRDPLLYWVAGPPGGGYRGPAGYTSSIPTWRGGGEVARIHGLGAGRYRGSGLAPGEATRLASQARQQIVRTNFTIRRYAMVQPPPAAVGTGGRATFGSRPKVKAGPGFSAAEMKRLRAFERSLGLSAIPGLAGSPDEASYIAIMRRLARDAKRAEAAGVSVRGLLGYSPADRARAFHSLLQKRGGRGAMDMYEAYIGAVAMTMPNASSMGLEEALSLVGQGKIDPKQAGARLRSELLSEGGYGADRRPSAAVKRYIAQQVRAQALEIRRHNALVTEATKHLQHVRRDFMTMGYAVHKAAALYAGETALTRAVYLDTEFANLKFHRTELSRQLGFAYGGALQAMRPDGSMSEAARVLGSELGKMSKDVARAASDPKLGDLRHRGGTSSINYRQVSPISSLGPAGTRDMPHFKPSGAGTRAGKLLHASGIAATMQISLNAEQTIAQLARAYVKMKDLPAAVLELGPGGRGGAILQHNIRKHTPVGPARRHSAKFIGREGGSGLFGSEYQMMLGSRALSGDAVLKYHRTRTEAAQQQLAADLKAVRAEAKRLSSRSISRYVTGRTGAKVTMAKLKAAASGSDADAALQDLMRVPRTSQGNLTSDPSGRLIDSIGADYKVVPGGALLGATSGSPYAYFVEFGFYKNLELNVKGWVPHRSEKAFDFMNEMRQRAGRQLLPARALAMKEGGEGFALNMEQLGDYGYFQGIYDSRVAAAHALIAQKSERLSADAQNAITEFASIKAIGFGGKDRFYQRGSSDVPRTHSGEVFGSTAGHHMFERGLNETWAQFQGQMPAKVRRVTAKGKK